MQNLTKQTRVRFSANTQASRSFTDPQIPPQKTQSFEGEEKRGQNWFQTQFAGQMSQDHDFNTAVEKVVAVAAAAYAIDSIEESSVRDQIKIGQGRQPSLPKSKSKKEEISITQDDDESEKVSGKDSIRSSEHADREVPIKIATQEKGPEQAVSSAPSSKKTTTSSNRHSERPDGFISRTLSKRDFPFTKQKSEAAKADTSTIRNGSAATTADIPTAKPRSAAQKTDIPTTDPASAVQRTDIPATTPDRTQTIKHRTQSGPAPGETKADIWESAEMAEIKERYEKLETTILEWENKKKAKATNKLHKTEGELDLRRAKALKKFLKEMEYIKQVVEGARAQAKERRRNDELKAKEKANKIRTTGEVPRTCFCLRKQFNYLHHKLAR